MAFTHRGRRLSKVIGHSAELLTHQARAIATKMIADVKTGRRHKLITPEARRFDNFGRLFFKRYASNWKPATLAGSRRACDAYLMPFFRGIDVGAILAEDVQRWFASLRDRPGAANRSLALLSVMMREADTNPRKGVSRYKLKKQARFKLNRII